ncbi:hypothetical protein ACSQ67_017038 [Phaseolus vulgaris]
MHSSTKLITDKFQVEAASSRQIPSGLPQDEVLKQWQDAWDERGNKDSEKQGINQHDFWSKLKTEATRKNPSYALNETQLIDLMFQQMGAEEAERFCKAFRQVHKKLVNEELSLDAARSFLKSS